MKKISLYFQLSFGIDKDMSEEYQIYKRKHTFVSNFRFKRIDRHYHRTTIKKRLSKINFSKRCRYFEYEELIGKISYLQP